MRQTRRRFLESLTAANIARMAAKIAPASLIPLGAPRSAHAEVVTVVIIVFTALAAIAKAIADHNRVDQNLPYFTAILRTLDNIGYAIYNVRLDIQDVKEQIAKQTTQIEELITNDSTYRYIASIRGYANAYDELLRGSPPDLYDWSAGGDAADDVRAEGRRILANIGDARRTLSEYRSGNGPLAVTAVPSAMFTELALLIRLGVQDARMREALISYDKWIDRLLDSSLTESIAWCLADAKAKQDVQIESVKSNRFFALLQEAPVANRAVYCLENQIGRDAFCVNQKPQRPFPSCINYALPWYSLYAVADIKPIDPDIAKKLNLWVPSWQEMTFAREFPDGTKYYGGRTPAFNPAPTCDAVDSHDIRAFQGQSAAERYGDLRSSPRWRKNDDDFRAFHKAVEEINLQRCRIALAASALTVALNLRESLSSVRSII
jgi:hypothetical protein